MKGRVRGQEGYVKNRMKPVRQPRVRCNDRQSLVNQKTPEPQQASKGEGVQQDLPAKGVRGLRKTSLTYFISLPAPENK